MLDVDLTPDEHERIAAAIDVDPHERQWLDYWKRELRRGAPYPMVLLSIEVYAHMKVSES